MNLKQLALVRMRFGPPVPRSERFDILEWLRVDEPYARFVIENFCVRPWLGQWPGSAYWTIAGRPGPVLYRDSDGSYYLKRGVQWPRTTDVRLRTV